MKQNVNRSILTLIVSAFLSMGVQAPVVAYGSTTDDKTGVILRVYGPGGPAPAMREAAQAFGKMKKITVEVTAGPTASWKEQAVQDADLIFSGAEHMMTDFVQKDLPGVIDPSSIRTLYLRPSAILVHPGNPKNIQGVKGLAKPGVHILVVQGAGKWACGKMWPDVPVT